MSVVLRNPFDDFITKHSISKSVIYWRMTMPLDWNRCEYTQILTVISYKFYRLTHIRLTESHLSICVFYGRLYIDYEGFDHHHYHHHFICSSKTKHTEKHSM